MEGIGDVSAAIVEVIEGLDETIATITSAAESVGGVADEARDGLDSFTRNTPAQIAELLAEMQLLSESLRVIAGEVVRNPNILVFGRPAPPEGPGE